MVFTPSPLSNPFKQTGSAPEMPLQKTQREPPEYGGALGATLSRRQSGCLELNELGAESWFWRLAQRNFRLPTSLPGPRVLHRRVRAIPKTSELVLWRRFLVPSIKDRAWQSAQYAVSAQ